MIDKLEIFDKDQQNELDKIKKAILKLAECVDDLESSEYPDFRINHPDYIKRKQLIESILYETI